MNNYMYIIYRERERVRRAVMSCTMSLSNCAVLGDTPAMSPASMRWVLPHTSVCSSSQVVYRTRILLRSWLFARLFRLHAGID